ncbi:MAG: hypothetical protein JW765_02400, partial [Deltaproteobacteria bacterium]|nr:hypothetical protein [Candidatus Zymogenaceae bacterium]
NVMTGILGAGMLLCNTAALDIQQLTHDVSVVNIEVPVRVYDGGRFVDFLTKDDFEVYENGVLQTVEAAYLIRKTEIVRSQAEAKPGLTVPAPPVQPDESIKRRVFLLYFEMDEYPPETNKAVDYLFENVLIDTDVVLFVTPNEQWKVTMSPDQMNRRADLAKEVKSRLAKSLRKSGLFVRGLIRELHDLAVYDDNDPWIKGKRVEDICDQILAYKILSEKKFRDFAGYFKPVEGQKHVFIFYQEETFSVPALFRYIYEKRIVDRHNQIDKALIREIFSDAETTVHFVYLRKHKNARGDVEYSGMKLDLPSRGEGGAQLGEMSTGTTDMAMDLVLPGDIFSAFHNLAVTTGGLAESTFNPVFGMKRVADAAENYYLLYYRPTSSPADKSFKKIEVKVKTGSYKIIHRSGYING